tara:strand:+ start:8578 stop:9000 length:423 start_codon:yes stop_codon:yes gene_type:complete
MAGLSPKLPLRRDEQDGYALNKSLRDMVQQNLKMLILTSPGERIMDPDFGVGLRRYLFEQNHKSTYSLIDSNVRAQVTKYFPAIRIINIDFKKPRGVDRVYDNVLYMNITYYVVPLQVQNNIDFELDFTSDRISELPGRS